MLPSKDDIIAFPAIENNLPSNAQILIDEEISKMTDSIRALKTRRNEMSPISKLPPELLCKIFEVVRQSGPGGSRFYGLSNLFRWTQITHVSRRWMQIALADTSLWSNIVITGRWPEWEEEAVKRSQNSPISIWVPAGTMELDYWKKLSVVEKALTQLQRVTKLTIEGLYPFDLHRILSDPKLPHPSLLHSLRLSTSFRESNGTLPTKTFKLFEEMLPKAGGLASLSLSGYGIDWDPPFFSNLVRLKIINIPTSFRPPAFQVLSALGAAQKLESLTLINFLLDSEASQHQVVYLPQLHKLHLCETATTVSKFIPFLTFRDDVSVCVDCNAEALSQTEFHTLLCIFDRSKTQKIQHLSLSESPLSQDIYVWEESKEDKTEDSVHFDFSKPPDITLSLDQMGLNEFADLTMRACRVLSLQYLETLTLVSNITIPLYEWIHIFGPLQHLKWMTLGTHAAIPLFQAIIFSDQILMPCLRDLSIKLDPYDISPTYIPIIQRALLKRQEQEIAMVNLNLFDSFRLKPEDVQALEKVVVCVKQSLWVTT